MRLLGKSAIVLGVAGAMAGLGFIAWYLVFRAMSRRPELPDCWAEPSATSLLAPTPKSGSQAEVERTDSSLGIWQSW